MLPDRGRQGRVKDSAARGRGPFPAKRLRSHSDLLTQPMPRILIVEDVASLRQLLHIVLSQEGHDVRVAADPHEALAMLCDGEPCFDLVVSNVGLPGIDGHELTRRIAARCPASRVLHISGDDPGCDNCPYTEKCPLLGKPFLPVEIAASVGAMLAKPPRQIRQT